MGIKDNHNFGICFDINGVLSPTSRPQAEAVRGLKKLTDTDTGEFKVPIAFITNTLSPDVEKAKEFSRFFGVKVNADQMVQVHGPLEMFNKYHSKRCLFLGQGDLIQIAKDLGFTNVVTIEEIADKYPDLGHQDEDLIVDKRRLKKENVPFEAIDAIFSLNEPADWDLALQLTLDVLMTDGHPDQPYKQTRQGHIPVLAANLDLNVTLEESHAPRFSHGAFLICLEALYHKLSGSELAYTALMGKPSEITFRYAEHVLHKLAQRMGQDPNIKTLYIIGDNQDSDIVGANLYQAHIADLRRVEAGEESSLDNSCSSAIPRSDSTLDFTFPESRRIPRNPNLTKQTVEDVNGILVTDGVFRPVSTIEPPNLVHLENYAAAAESTASSDVSLAVGDDSFKTMPLPRRRSDIHRDFEPNLRGGFMRPSATVKSVLDAVNHIFELEDK